MLKLKTYSAGAALAAAIAMGSNSAFATLQFDLQLASGGHSVPGTTAAGTTLNLDLYANITDPGSNGVYDLGGSYVSTGGGGTGQGFSASSVASVFTNFGSSPGTVFNAPSNSIWGGGTAASTQYNDAGFVYFRSGTQNPGNPIAATTTSTPGVITNGSEILL